MTIQVLGSGCATCARLHQVVQQALQELSSEAQVEYLTGSAGLNRMIELGAMSSPVLVADGQIIQTGFSGNVAEIKQKLQVALNS